MVSHEVWPNFLVIGAYKSGTTSIYSYLRKHPDVYMPLIKEPSFFALEGEVGEIPKNKTARLKDYLQLFDAWNGESAVGEASPIYLQSRKAAQRISHYIPGAKLVAILRNPVEAFHSNHYMRIRLGKTDKDFSSAVDEYLDRLKSSPDAGPFYFKHLSYYFELFDPRQIRVYLFDDLKRDSAALMKDLYGFIDVDPEYPVDVTRRQNRGRIPRSRYLYQLSCGNTPLGKRIPARLRTLIDRLNSQPIPDMSKEDRTRLMECFGEDIEQLGRLIGRDLSMWLNGPSGGK